MAAEVHGKQLRTKMIQNVDLPNPVKGLQKFGNPRMYRNAVAAEAEESTMVSIRGRMMPSATERSIPVAKNNLTGTQTGILNEGQKLWTRGKPNEGHIENPVLKKLQKEIKAKKKKKTESYFASQEVRGLSSVIPESEYLVGSGILERIQANRKDRHSELLDEMFQELTMINSELEPQIVEACSTVKEYLEEDQANVTKEVKLLDKDEDLINFSSAELHDHWKQIEHHTLVRQSWIEELDLTLHAIETDRASMIRETYKAYTQKLLRVAHLMPPDVHKLMEDESLATNQTLLANKCSCADLIRKLKMSNMERERKLFFKWEQRVKDWKHLKIDIIIGRFNSFMTSPDMTKPPNLTRAMNSLVADQRQLNDRRKELFKILTEMKPPGSTRTAVYQWQNSLTSITEQLDDVHQQHYGILKYNFDEVLHDCEEELSRVVALLLKESICTEDEVDMITTEYLSPLVGEKIARYEYELEKYEKYTEEISAEQKQMFRQLFKFLQGASSLWDAHEIGLTKEERELLEKLDKNRKEHDTQNQIKEAKFDIVMDRMRQDAFEEALAMSLKQSLEMLDEIKKSYHDFHGLQIKTAKLYPSLVDEEVKRYGVDVCSYFNVSQVSPKKPKRKEQSREEKNGIVQDEDGAKPVEKHDTKVIELSSGVTYYVLKADNEPFIPPETAATARTSYTFLSDDLDEVEVMPYVASFAIPEDLMLQIKEGIRKEFLEHLVSWKTEATLRAESVMTAKIEELNNELDLRLHLHEPRAGRAEKDVHNVRAAELVLHRDRVTQHCQGILSSLSTFKSRFSSMIHEHDIETEKFKNSVESLENTFVSARKSHELLSIKDEVANQLEEYMKIIRASLRKFRQDLDEMLNNLRNSNARFRRMLKIFSEGGNFCPEEVDEFRKKLEYMASKIDNAEGLMMGELEGMETKRLDAAHECSGKLEDRFKYHLFDLTFLEKISRWLTNVQVKIKSEVADSNSQALLIAKLIATFDRRIDAVLRPNLDREQINASELHNTLMPILEKFHERVRYLDCGVNEPITSTVSDVPVKVSESRQEDAKAMNRRTRRVKASDSSLAATSKSKVSLLPKSSMRRADSEQRPVTVPTSKSSSKASVLGKTSSEAEGEKIAKIKSESSNPRNSASKPPSKVDKRFLVFGDDADETQDHFLSRIKSLCRSGLEGLLLTSELYYRQKGSRIATRPSAVHDNFDLCAESLVNRLQSYLTQAEAYHNTCLQELRAQVDTFGNSLLKFPPLIVNFSHNEHAAALTKSRKASKKNFLRSFESLEKQKRDHQTLLRPTLGHPGNQSELEKLTASEERRRTEMGKLIDTYGAQKKEIHETYAKNFVQALNELTDTLLQQFDNNLTKDDIQQGKVIPKPKTEKQLLRERMNSNTRRDSGEKVAADKLDWRTLSFENLLNGSSKEGDLIRIRKLTKQHAAVIQARDITYEKFCADFANGTSKIKDDIRSLQDLEQRWTENWGKSIQKILDLY